MNRSLALLRKRTLKIAAFVAVSMMILGNVVSVTAAPLTGASVELGDPRTSTTSTYTVDAAGFTTGTAIACVNVVLAANADGTGSVAGLNTGSSTLSSTSLLSDGNWAVSNATGGTLSITNSSTTETPIANGNIVWGGVTNGSADGTTYYGVMTTYTDASCTGGNEVDAVTMAFVYKDGALVSLTIEPTLTFAINAVATSQTVNGATTTIGSSATSIDHGTSVTSSANGISAHDLVVTTNAAGGYIVYLRNAPATLTNAASDTITLHTGSNGTPTAFPAAGTEAWGYTTDDSDLAQFTSNTWAGFNTINEEVMKNANATSGSDTSRVGHQVGIATDTEAGTYETTMIYTIVATYQEFK